MPFPDDRKRHSIGIAFVLWARGEPAAHPVATIADAVEHLATEHLANSDEWDPDPTAPTAAFVGALLGGAEGPALVWRQVPVDRVGDEIDFSDEIQEIVDLVDYNDLDVVGHGLGDLVGLGDMIEELPDRGPDWLRDWVAKGRTGPPQVPSDHDDGYSRGGAGHPSRTPDSTKRPDAGLFGGSPAERLGMSGRYGAGDVDLGGSVGGGGAQSAFGPYGTGLGDPGDQLMWGMDAIQDARNSQARFTAAASLAALGFAISMSKGAVPAAVFCGTVAVVSYLMAEAASEEANRLEAERRAKDDAEKKKMPDPGDEEGGGRSPIKISQDLQLMDREMKRYHVTGEWMGGEGYGWVRFGAPRANPALPVGAAMPSDTSDERPVFWIAGNVDSGGTDMDSWFVGKTSWAWKKFAAPRIRTERAG